MKRPSDDYTKSGPRGTEGGLTVNKLRISNERASAVRRASQCSRDTYEDASLRRFERGIPLSTKRISPNKDSF
jgi:hypothetical protein